MDQLDKLFQSIYGDLNGAYISPTAPFPVEDAFAERTPCNVLYREVFDCKVRLNDRLNEDEDPDIEKIIDNLLEIAEILSKKMFEYGVKVQESRL